jgi:hypothetical protein
MTGEEPRVLWDHREMADEHEGRGLAIFRGPGGFTLQIMKRNFAKGIADALGIPFVEVITGTLTPKENQTTKGTT